MKTIKKYKGVSLKYSEQDGKIYFNYEDRERKVKYVFEAEEIIDEPRWEDCELYGYFVDGYQDKYIGLTKATRKDIKSGNPDWLHKGKYDGTYKASRGRVILKTIENDEVYSRWEKQREVYLKELTKLNNIAGELK